MLVEKIRPVALWENELEHRKHIFNAQNEFKRILNPKLIE